MKERNNKIILITGASDGIGKVTAMTLAKEGHTLILHGRSKVKTEAVCEEIKNTTGNNHIDMYLADFLSLSEVKSFAEKIKKKYDHLDVLINNAGAQFGEKRELTNEGHEKTMTINVLAPMLLTNLLIELFGKSQSARVVTVASDAHRMTGRPDFNDIELAESYTLPKAYGLSKLYIIWIMQHFVKVAHENGIHNITFNSVHPASTQSSLGREAMKSLKWKIIYVLWQFMMIPIDKAASSSISAAISPNMEGVTGRYFGPKGEEKPSEKYYSSENEKKIWDYFYGIIKPYL